MEKIYSDFLKYSLSFLDNALTMPKALTQFEKIFKFNDLGVCKALLRRLKDKGLIKIELCIKRV
jgi:hypothetical protein